MTHNPRAYDVALTIWRAKRCTIPMAGRHRRGRALHHARAGAVTRQYLPTADHWAIISPDGLEPFDPLVLRHQRGALTRDP